MHTSAHTQKCPQGHTLASTFRALQYRNFRLFFPGVAICQIGLWIQNVAISWLVYDMTKSPLTMGTVMFFNAIPLFVLTPFAGVIIDKFHRQKLLTAVQILFTLQAFLMALVTYLGLIQIWNIVALGVFLNCIAAIDVPLRQSTFVCLVDDPRDLSNAISLNSTCFNVARLLGPAIGGLLIANYGVGACFIVNFLCILPIVFLTMMLDIKDVKCGNIQNETILEGLKEGIEYAAKTPQISTLLLYLAVFSFIGMTYPMLMPIYTTEVLAANADTLGFLMGATGVGALVSSLFLAAKTTIIGLRRVLFAGAVVLSLGFIVLGLTNSKIIALIAMFFVGLGVTSSITPDNTLTQAVVDDDKRGRVMSLNAICYMGTTSISSFVAGFIAHLIGIAHTLILFGVVMLCFGTFFAYRFSKLTFKSKL